MVPHVKLDTGFRDGGRVLSDTEYRVYVQLGLHVDNDGLCWPKISTLAGGCGKSDRAVQTAIRRLCGLGWVDIVQFGGRGPKNPNVYRINRYFSFGTNRSAPLDDSKGEAQLTLKGAKGENTDIKGEATCTPKGEIPDTLRVKSPHDRRRTSIEEEPVKEEPSRRRTRHSNSNLQKKWVEDHLGIALADIDPATLNDPVDFFHKYHLLVDHNVVKWLKEGYSSIPQGEMSKQSFAKLLETLRTLPGWKPEDADKEWLKDFLQEFSLTESHAKACRDWWDGKHPAKDKGDWKNRLRNGMKGEVKRGRGNGTRTVRQNLREDRPDEEVGNSIGKPLR